MNNSLILGLRLLAFLFDLGIGAGFIGLSFMFMEFLSKTFEHSIMGVLSLVALPFILALPILYMGICTSYFGKTLGKWICRLEVVDNRHGKLGLWKSLGREAIKVFMFVSNIGIIVYVIQIAINGKILHDHLCHTEVNFIGGLSETQKNWRKYHKDNP